ncbi:hypothetical protein [Halobaculum sp. MBLA0143]|uniref:hypothetical protein n=1 Tax=Halobaculum sp. MBLA0143 TaxID=3079933 RepID=UPI0035236C07
MSLLGDSLSLLGDETTALAFLPVVNWVYILVASQSPSVVIWVQIGSTVVLATVLFNLLENLDVDQESEEEADTTQAELYEGILLVGAAIVWAAMLLWSIWSLIGLFDSDEVISEVLVVVSAVVLLLISSHILFRSCLPSYE